MTRHYRSSPAAVGLFAAILVASILPFLSTPATRAAVITTECGTGGGCAGLRMTTVVSGGTATPSDWDLVAVRNNTAEDEFPFTSGQTRTVPRNTSGGRTIYTLFTAPTTDAASQYTSTFSCEQSGPTTGNANATTNISIANRTVSFGTASTGNPTTRFAYCTFTHTFVPLAQTIATINVSVGGDRTNTAQVGPLDGVVLELYDLDGSPVDEPWSQCTSGTVTTGVCTFEVPYTQDGGQNRDRRFLIRQVSAPSGWFINDALRTGNNDGQQSQATTYQFMTGTQLRAGSTYESSGTGGFAVGTGTQTRTASGGIWQQSRDNPPLPETCGLNVAVILDLSLSVDSDELEDLKDAADAFATALTGTPSRMALFSFANTSPSRYTQPNFPDLMSVATEEGAAAFKARYATWMPTGATNWDNALWAATLPQGTPDSPNHYDVALVLTDGNPTAYGQLAAPNASNPNGTGEGAQTYNRLREVENAIFSANALKDKETRVIALGVGSGVLGDDADIIALNLAAISGDEEYDGTNVETADFYQLDDYDDAADAFRSLVFEACSSSVTVSKALVPSTNDDGDFTGALPAPAGWSLSAEPNEAGATVVGPTTQETTDDGTGSVNFPVDFSVTDPVNFTIGEGLQTAYDFFGAVCTARTADGTVIQLDEVIDATTDPDNPSLTVDIPAGQQANCTLYNRRPGAAVLEVFKRWTINGIDYANGVQPTAIGAALVLTEGTEGWSPSVNSGYTVGEDTVGLAEGVFYSGLDLCTVISAQVTDVRNGPDAGNLETVDGFSPGPFPFASNPTSPAEFPDPDYLVPLDDVFTQVDVHNTMECGSELALRKEVRGGTLDESLWADPSDWTLDAIEPDGSAIVFDPVNYVPADGVEFQPVSPQTTYQLAESGGDVRYRQTDVRTNLASNPDSTGSAYCQLSDEDGEPISGVIDGLNGGANVPMGQRMVCTIINRTAELTLLKFVTNDQAGTAAPDDWELTATPIEFVDENGDTQSPPASLGDETVPGSSVQIDQLDDPVNANRFQVLPYQVYEISESGPAGYTGHLEKLVEQDGFLGWVNLDDLAPGEYPGDGPEPGEPDTDVDVDEGTQLRSLPPENTYPRKNAAGNWELYILPVGHDTYRWVNDDDAQPLEVEKDAHTAFVRDYDWAIAKSVVGEDSATVALGADAEFTYDVVVTPSGPEDTDFTIAGVVTIANPNLDEGDVPVPLTITDVITIDGVDDPAGVTCALFDGDTELGDLLDPEGVPYDVPSAPDLLTRTIDTLVYECTIPDGVATATSTGTNAITITWDAAEVPGVDPPSATTVAEFDFAAADITVTDQTVVVSDTAPEFVETFPDAGDRTVDAAVLFAAEQTSQTFTYSRQVGSDVGVGECLTYDNTASLPVTTDQDTLESTATVEVCVPLYGWSFEKSSDPTSGSTVLPGDIITYTVTAEPFGDGVVTGVVVNDDISDVISNATLDESSITTSVGDAALSGTTIAWDIGDLEASATLTYQVTVDEDARGVTIGNVASGIGSVPPEDCPAEEGDTAEIMDPPDCRATVHYTPAWELEKTADPASGSVVAPESTITYTLTVTNTGPGDLPGATVTDDLTDVLSHATLVEPLATGLTLSGTTLTWTVGPLEPDESATVLYAVTINADQWNVTLVNDAAPGDILGECVGECSTTHTTPTGGTLPDTGGLLPAVDDAIGAINGGSPWTLLTLVGLILAAGLAVAGPYGSRVWARSRRRVSAEDQ